MCCAQQVIGDERHLVFECPALQSIRDRYRYPGLFGADLVTMQQIMWQLDIVGVAHYVMGCFAVGPVVLHNATMGALQLPSVLSNYYY